VQLQKHGLQAVVGSDGLVEGENMKRVKGRLVGNEKGLVNCSSIFFNPCFVVLFKEMSCSILLDSKTTFRKQFGIVN